MIGLMILLFTNMRQAQLKISAHIHTIKLKVRFPCSITASLRVGKPPSTQSRKKFPTDKIVP